MDSIINVLTILFGISAVFIAGLVLIDILSEL